MANTSTNAANSRKKDSAAPEKNEARDAALKLQRRVRLMTPARLVIPVLAIWSLLCLRIYLRLG